MDVIEAHATTKTRPTHFWIEPLWNASYKTFGPPIFIGGFAIPDHDPELEQPIKDPEKFASLHGHDNITRIHTAATTAMIVNGCLGNNGPGTNREFTER